MRDRDASGPLALRPDLSFWPHTRPETRGLLVRLVPEVLRLLAGFPVPVTERCDLLLVAGSRAARDALAHATQLAAGFDLPVEPAGEAGGCHRVRVRDVHRLRHEAFLEASEGWLAARGVQQMPPDAPTEDCDLVVLADDQAARARAGPDLGRLGTFTPATALLTEPSRPLAARLAYDLDSGALLWQRASGAVQIFGAASPWALPHGLSGVVEKQPLRLAGRVADMRFASADGAPVLGAPRRGRATVLLGLAPDAMMIAPMLARWLTGKASEAENRWCAAHGATRSARSPAIAEYAPAHGVEA